MKKVYLFLIFIISLESIFAFGQKEVVIDAKNKIVVALVLDNNGLGDNSVNDSCYSGLQRASEDGYITLRTKSAGDDEEKLALIKQFTTEGVDALFLIGESNREIIVESAINYPETFFCGVDIILTEDEFKDNLIGINFKEQDGGYLAGLVAGSLTYRYKRHHDYLNTVNRVGIILGKNSPDIKRYELGFYAGVKEVNPPCEIISININTLEDPEKGREALLELKEKGVDIVLAVAGGSNIGIFSAAEEENILVIGANRDLSNLSENIVTSIVKKISVPVYLIMKEFKESGITGNVNRMYGLNDGAIYLAPYYKYDKYIPKDITDLLSKMSKKLIKGSTVIPSSIEEVEFDPEKVPEIIGEDSVIEPGIVLDQEQQSEIDTEVQPVTGEEISEEDVPESDDTPVAE